MRDISRLWLKVGGPLAAAVLLAGGCAQDPCDGDDAYEGSLTIRTMSDIDELSGKLCVTGSLLIGDIEHEPSATGSGVQGFELSAFVLSLDGLEDLQIVEGDLQIAGNLLLTDLSGLSGLTHVGRELRVDEYPRGDFIIHQNPLLPDLDGLDDLFLVGANVIISNNDLLTSIDGMTSLERVGWEFRVLDNARLDRADIDQYTAQISAVGGFQISGNGEQAQ